MNVLTACERSGRVRDAFRALGHNALSADIEPTDVDGPHHQGDVLPLLAKRWDMVIGFPPCTDLSVIGAKFWAEKQTDGRQRRAVAFVHHVFAANSPRVAVENPVGYLNTYWRKPDQIIHPWQFGDPWQKRTCIWLRGLPILLPTEIVEPVGHWVDGGSRVKNKGVRYGGEGFGSSQDAKRKAQRSQTFPGIAAAMAHQWGGAA